ncbi:MAG: hypothetical protein MUF26_05250 [Syntrophales bacterium]|nr:hypothetical protein [Syntrophales bacterium]
MRLNREFFYRLGIVLGGIIFLFGCAGASNSVSLAGSGGAYERIAVLPFVKADPGDSIDQLVPREIASHMDVNADSAENVVESIFVSKLGANKNIDIIPTEQVEGLYRQITLETISPKEAELISKLGQGLKADAIVVGYVYRYQERVGTPYAVEKPASVAFEIHLIDVDAGLRSWRATFDKTQRSLMENLFNFRFFVKDKGRWITARELAAEGVDEIMQNFPAAKR